MLVLVLACNVVGLTGDGGRTFRWCLGGGAFSFRLRFYTHEVKV